MESGERENEVIASQSGLLSSCVLILLATPSLTYCISPQFLSFSSSHSNLPQNPLVFRHSIISPTWAITSFTSHFPLLFSSPPSLQFPFRTPWLSYRTFLRERSLPLFWRTCTLPCGCGTETKNEGHQVRHSFMYCYCLLYWCCDSYTIQNKTEQYWMKNSLMLLLRHSHNAEQNRTIPCIYCSLVLPVQLRCVVDFLCVDWHLCVSKLWWLSHIFS